jgi:Gp37 protein
LIAFFEDLIIAKLKSALPAIDVQPLPLAPEELGYPVTENQIYVAFESESFRPVDGGMVDRFYYQQTRKLRYELVLRLMDLFGQRRSYDIINRIRDALTGLGSGNLSRMGLYQVSGGYKRYADGLWLYQMQFEVPVAYALRVEDA